MNIFRRLYHSDTIDVILETALPIIMIILVLMALAVITLLIVGVFAS